MRDELLAAVPARRGHFRLASGHHGDRWLDLDAFFLRPGRVAPFAAELARRLAPLRPEVVCGPLTGGAFLAQTVAAALGLDFAWSERVPPPPGGTAPAAYRLPAAPRAHVRGRRVTLVDDATNAGTAARATLADLRAAGAVPVALGALLVLGTPSGDLAAEAGIPLVGLAEVPNTLWDPGSCPLCAAGVPLETPTG